MRLQSLLIVIAALLALILWTLLSIAARLKERFPTEREVDRAWAQADPIDHREAPSKDKE